MAAHILVVDPSAAALALVRTVLDAVGYRVSSSQSARRGLELASETGVDLILLALDLDDGDGVTFCQELAATLDAAQPGVVMMASRQRLDSTTLSNTPLLIDSIAQPFSPEAILAVTSYSLERLARRGSDPDTTTTLAEPNAVARERLQQALGEPSAPKVEIAAIDVDTETQDAPVLTPNQLIEALAAALLPALKQTGVDNPETLAGNLVSDALTRLPPFVDTLPPPNTTLWCDLAHIALPEILQLLQLQNQAGVLQIWHQFKRIDVFLKRGRVVAARASNLDEEFLLGRFLVARGYIGQTELDQLASSAHSTVSMPLGEKLIRLGHISAEDLRQAIHDQCCELVYEALRLHRGSCRFVARILPPPAFDHMLVDLSVQELMFEGLRRVDEWGVIERVVDSFDTVFAPRAAERNALTSDERRVLSLIDGKRSVRDLVKVSRMRPFEACKLIYRLASTRAIERSQRD